MIQVPETTSSPFRVTHASHLVYTVRDLSRSRDFYTKVLGLVVTDEDREGVYLRGVEERSHHSLVLKRTDGAPSAVRTGLRTFDDEDLDRAKAYFEGQGLKAEFIETPYQGRTLHAFDLFGTPLEFCSSMPRLERVDQRFESLRAPASFASITTRCIRLMSRSRQPSTPVSASGSSTTWSSGINRWACSCTPRIRSTMSSSCVGRGPPCTITDTSSAASTRSFGLGTSRAVSGTGTMWNSVPDDIVSAIPITFTCWTRMAIAGVAAAPGLLRRRR